jgi:hypothetical protein
MADAPGTSTMLSIKFGTAVVFHDRVARIEHFKLVDFEVVLVNVRLDWRKRERPHATGILRHRALAL